ncbi:MAG: hypothetical protein K5891_00980 [Lachnospiraceae bacterium]|nr:hypothetical protein [Lachnospiraceae bacterium]
MKNREKDAKQKDEKKEYRRKKASEGSSSRTIRWDKLDNTANLFPVIAGEGLTNVYRISVTLTEEIVPERLQEALDIILPKFDGFNVRLRKGVFWYYFEENGKPAPRVEEETLFPCRFIRANKNHSYLFRVSYYECRINLEVFHVLTDGMGGLNFIRELTYQYLRLSHPELRGDEGDRLTAGTSLNLEDSFLRNFKEAKPSGFNREKAFLIKGETLDPGEFGMIHGYLPIAQLKERTHALGVSINEYLVAVFAWSIYREAAGGKIPERPIRIAVPVNLRPYYDSVTTKNFFVVVSATFMPEKQDVTFEEVLEAVKTSLRSQINKENLENLFSYSVSNQKNLFLRPIPLPLKGIAMRIVYNWSATANTTTMTNVGNVQVEDAYKPYIRRFHACIAMSKGQSLKGTICSYDGTLVFTFSTILSDTAVEKGFFRKIAEDGIDVTVETNGVFYE